jgi:hypothetical protein
VKPSIFVSTFAILATFSLIFLGLQENLAKYEMYFALLMNSNFTPHENSVQVLYNTLYDNHLIATEYFGTAEGKLAIISSILAISPSLIVAAVVWFRILRKNRKRKLCYLTHIILLSNFSPLALSVLAADFPRWIAFFVTNMFVSSIWILYNDDLRENLEFSDIEKAFGVFCIAYSAIVGPLDVTQGTLKFQSFLRLLW